MKIRTRFLAPLLVCALLQSAGGDAPAFGREPDRTAPASPGSWKFVVGGDSRNCGDVVMPAVAAGAISSGAALYWHLGDFRALHDFDEDLLQARRVAGEKPMTIIDYNRGAWDDFLQSQ